MLAPVRISFADDDGHVIHLSLILTEVAHHTIDSLDNLGSRTLTVLRNDLDESFGAKLRAVGRFSLENSVRLHDRHLSNTDDELVGVALPLVQEETQRQAPRGELCATLPRRR